MNVNRSELLSVLVAVGVDTAEGWTAEQMQAKVNAAGGLARYKESDIANPAASALYERLAAAQAAGDELVVIDDQAEMTAATKETAVVATKTASKKKAKSKAKKGGGGGTAVATKPKAKSKAKKGTAVAAAPRTRTTAVHNGHAKSLSAMSWGEKVEYWKKHPKSITDRGPGILKRIVDELKKAGKPGRGGKPKPVTKDDLVGILHEAFPERKPEQMSTYLNNMVPTGLRDEYGIQVESVKLESGLKGYYIEEKK